MTSPDDHDPDRHGDRGMPAGMPDAGALPVVGDTAKLIAEARDKATAADELGWPLRVSWMLNALADALEAAKRDTERLNWLDNHCVEVSECYASGTVKILSHVPAEYGAEDHSDLRVSIDAERSFDKL